MDRDADSTPLVPYSSSSLSSSSPQQRSSTTPPSTTRTTQTNHVHHLPRTSAGLGHGLDKIMAVVSAPRQDHYLDITNSDPVVLDLCSAVRLGPLAGNGRAPWHDPRRSQWARSDRDSRNQLLPGDGEVEGHGQEQGRRNYDGGGDDDDDDDEARPRDSQRQQQAQPPPTKPEALLASVDPDCRFEGPSLDQVHSNTLEYRAQTMGFGRREAWVQFEEAAERVAKIVRAERDCMFNKKKKEEEEKRRKKEAEAIAEARQVRSKASAANVQAAMRRLEERKKGAAGKEKKEWGAEEEEEEEDGETGRRVDVKNVCIDGDVRRDMTLLTRR